MAKLLEQVQSGKTTEPRRVMLYGTHGIGKSTWGAQAPKPIFIQTEDGLGQVECDRFPMPASYGGAYGDDSQIVKLIAEKRQPVPGGRAIVRIDRVNKSAANPD